MPGAGDLRDRISFEQRREDANGDRLGAWEPEFTRWAQLVYPRGGEVGLHQRLEGKQPVVIVVREDSGTRQITSAWRAVDARNADRVFNITSAAPHKERGFIEITATMGGATG